MDATGVRPHGSDLRMTPLQEELWLASERLFAYLEGTHWDGRALTGPDPGVRYNSRIWRFTKSYTRWWNWKDDLQYIQAQKYWIGVNALYWDLDPQHPSHLEKNARASAQFLLEDQHPDGYWSHPNPEWEGRIATVEGNYGTIGMLEVFKRWGGDALLDAAKRWYEYATTHIGLRTGDGFAAINYFESIGIGNVPNVTVSALRTFALLAELSGEGRFTENQDAMVRWLHHVQLESGELPYRTLGPDGSGDNSQFHFLCYQYNAFELINLVEYHQITQDSNVIDLIGRLAAYVATGVTEEGACRYDCFKDGPEVSYYTAAAAAALTQATEMGLGDYSELAARAYRRLLSQQLSDGSMKFYSSGNYRVLTDRRSYPRYLAMTLYLMLLGTDPYHVESHH